MAEEKKSCGVEFPHFGASYPDAKCINGYLYDMDSYEDGGYTIGGDDPCPICNTEEWLKDALDDEIFKTREDALKYVDFLRSKYAHRVEAEEKKTTLEEAAKEYATTHLRNNEFPTADSAFIAGAEWQKQQMIRDCSIQASYEAEIEKAEERGYNLCKEQMMTNEEMKCALRMEYEKGVFDTKQQMLKDAVDGVVMDFSSNLPRPQVDVRLDPHKYHTGDKVKIIIVKEG